MNAITKQQAQPLASQFSELGDTGFICSIGPAVDLAQLQEHMKELSRKPWGSPEFQQIP